MKKNVSKLLGFVLALTLVFGIAAVPVSATEVATLYVGGVEMYDGDYLASGATEVSAEAPAEEGYAYFKDGVLTLVDYVYAGEGYTYYDNGSDVYTSVIYSTVALKIELVGDSSITNTFAGSDGITCDSDLTIDGDGTIAINAVYGIYSDIYGKAARLTIDGGALSFIDSNTAIYLCGNDANAVFEINNGSISCDATYGVAVESYAIEGNASLIINGGEIIANCEEALYAYSVEATSDITINGGRVSATAVSDAFNADVIYVNGGIVDAEATAQDEGVVIIGELIVSEDVAIIAESDSYLSTHFTYYAGDANGDKVIDMFDYLLIKGIYFENVDYSYEEFVRADANCDGLVDMFDYLIAKSLYFTGEEPTLLPEVDTVTPAPDIETAYTKLYNYIVENGVATEGREGVYNIMSDPVVDTDSTRFTIGAVEANTTDESILIGGVYSMEDASEMMVVTIILEPNTVTFNLMAAYISNEYNEFYTGTVTAGGCVAGEIDIQNFSGNAIGDTPLETIEKVCEITLNNSLAITEELIEPSGVSLADFGFDCFAEPI